MTIRKTRVARKLSQVCRKKNRHTGRTRKSRAARVINRVHNSVHRVQLLLLLDEPAAEPSFESIRNSYSYNTVNHSKLMKLGKYTAGATNGYKTVIHIRLKKLFRWISSVWITNCRPKINLKMVNILKYYVGCADAPAFLWKAAITTEL